MDLFDAIYALRATRVYDDRPIPADVLDADPQAATMACSSGNTQPWEFVRRHRSSRASSSSRRCCRRPSVTDRRRRGADAGAARRRRRAGPSPVTRPSRTSTASPRSCSCSGTPTAASACRASTRRTPTARSARLDRHPRRARRQPVPGVPEHDAGGARARRVVAVHDVLRAVPARGEGAAARAAADVPGVRGVPRLRRRAAREPAPQAARGGGAPRTTGTGRTARDHHPADHLGRRPRRRATRRVHQPPPGEVPRGRAARRARTGRGDDVPRREVRLRDGRQRRARSPTGGSTKAAPSADAPVARARASRRKTCRWCR